MPVVKKRNQQTESRLLLEGGDPIELPPAEVEEQAVLLQFAQYRPFIPELLEELRDGTIAEPVAVMNDGSTYAIHCDTRTFWVKLWYVPDSQLTRIDRVQVISCLPITMGMQVLVEDYEDQAISDSDDFDDSDNTDKY